MFKAYVVYHSCFDGFSSSHRFESRFESLGDALDFLSAICRTIDENHRLSYCNIQYLEDSDEEVYF